MRQLTGHVMVENSLERRLGFQPVQSGHPLALNKEKRALIPIYDKFD